MPQKSEPTLADSWRFRRRSVGALARSTGACLKGTCRDDPIPPGVYWIAVPWEDSQFTGVPKPQHWQLWLDAMVSLKWVKLLKTQHHEGVLLPGSDEPPIDWHLFEVLHDAPRWPPATSLGLPTVAPNGIQTVEEDTIQAPEPESGKSLWDRILPESTSGKILVTSVVLGGAALIIYGMTRN